MKKKFKRRIGTIGLHILIAAISLTFAFPLIWMFMTSFKTPREYYRMPPKLLPNQLVLFHYKEAFAPWTIDPTELSESTYYIEESAGRVESVVPNIGHSLIVITGSVCLSLLVGIWAAYSLSRFNFRGSKNMGIWILSTRMMPPIFLRNILPRSHCHCRAAVLGDAQAWSHRDASGSYIHICHDTAAFCYMDDEGIFR